MEIPDINELRKKTLEEKNKTTKDNLDSLLNHRKELRKKWAPKRVDKYNTFLKNLKQAHNNYVIALRNEIIIKTKLLITEDPNSKGFNLVQPQFIDADIGTFNGISILKGLWDKKKRKYSRISHIEAGIDKTPLEEVITMFKENGFKIEVVSNKTDNIIIRIKFTET